MSQEREIRVLSGWFMLLVELVLLGTGIWLFIHSVSDRTLDLWPFLTAIGMIVVFALFANGFFTLQPNEARVLILFGSYRGTVRTAGFHWTNPFNSQPKISLRSRNLNGDNQNEFGMNEIQI